nr:Tn3 family transposase [Polaromonas jejuensis]
MLLEAGPPDNHPFIHVPATFVRIIGPSCTVQSPSRGNRTFNVDNVAPSPVELHWDALVHLTASMMSGQASAVAALARFDSAAQGDPIFHKPAARLSDYNAARLVVMLPRPKFFEKLPNLAYLLGYAATIVARMEDAMLP